MNGSFGLFSGFSVTGLQGLAASWISDGIWADYRSQPTSVDRCTQTNEEGDL